MKKKYNNGKNSPKFIDLKNKRFNKLIAKEYILHETKSGNQNYVWLCNCDCGDETIARTNDLRSGNKRQCKNCSIKEASLKRTKSNHESLINRIYRNYKRTAKNRNLVFEISKKDFIKFIKKDCYYCGNKPHIYRGEKNYNYSDELFKRNGIDRINSSIGYEINNVVTCCEICNKMKMDLNLDVFLLHVNNIYDNFLEKRSETIPNGSTSQANGDGNSTSLNNKRLI